MQGESSQRVSLPSLCCCVAEGGWVVNVTRECVCRCWLSMLTSHHCREFRSNLAIVHLIHHNCFLTCPLHPLSIVAGYVFHVSQSYTRTSPSQNSCAQIGSTAPPLATLAPQSALVVYIINVCSVTRLGTYVVCNSSIATVA